MLISVCARVFLSVCDRLRPFVGVVSVFCARNIVSVCVVCVVVPMYACVFVFAYLQRVKVECAYVCACGWRFSFLFVYAYGVCSPSVRYEYSS